MAMNHYNITGTEWTAISTVGQSGSCWLNKSPVNGRCMVYHADSVPNTNLVEYGKSCFVSTKNHDILTITADSTSDIFYAMMDAPTATATIIVDVK